MSTTLNLADHLLARARYRQHLGRHRDALRLLTSLTRLRDLPAAVAEEVQFRLGQICLRLGKPRRARRHFAAALHHRPDSPRYHFFLGRALDADRDGDPGRAAEHYRTSLDLDGTQADVLYHFGSLALRLGRADEALPCLRAAAAQAPDDPRLLAKVAAALRTARRTEEARGLLLAARFRHPHDGRYLKLWNDFQFQQARREQEAARRTAGRAAHDDEPVLLPFARRERPAAAAGVVAGKIIRHDTPSAPAPHRPKPARLPDRRQAR